MIKRTSIKTPLLFENAGEIENWKKTFSNHGGLDIETGVFVPLKNVKKMLEESSCAVSFIMDSIAGASEYGSIALCDYSDFKELFAKLKEIGIFLQALAEYGECFWLNERHLHAFFNNLIYDEMDCISYASIANWLEDNAE